jgi:hypothetical protein
MSVQEMSRNGKRYGTYETNSFDNKFSLFIEHSFSKSRIIIFKTLDAKNDLSIRYASDQIYSPPFYMSSSKAV